MFPTPQSHPNTTPAPYPKPPIPTSPHPVLGDMCQRGLLNIYALAEPLVEQNDREFTSTIQVGAPALAPTVIAAAGRMPAAP